MYKCVFSTRHIQGAIQAMEATSDGEGGW